MGRVVDVMAICVGALVFDAYPAGWAVGAGAAIYFTCRLTFEVYDAYYGGN